MTTQLFKSHLSILFLLVSIFSALIGILQYSNRYEISFKTKSSAKINIFLVHFFNLFGAFPGIICTFEFLNSINFFGQYSILFVPYGFWIMSEFFLISLGHKHDIDQASVSCDLSTAK